MRFILTALLGFFAYIPATAMLQQTEFFGHLLTLMALSPNSAVLTGASVIWPAVFLCACYGIADIAWTALMGGSYSVAKLVVTRDSAQQAGPSSLISASTPQ